MNSPIISFQSRDRLGWVGTFQPRSSSWWTVQSVQFSPSADWVVWEICPEEQFCQFSSVPWLIGSSWVHVLRNSSVSSVQSLYRLGRLGYMSWGTVQSVQFSPSTDWVVGGTWVAFQQKSRSWGTVQSVQFSPSTDWVIGGTYPEEQFSKFSSVPWQIGSSGGQKGCFSSDPVPEEQFSQFSSVPRPIWSSGGLKGCFSTDPLLEEQPRSSRLLVVVRPTVMLDSVFCIPLIRFGTSRISNEYKNQSSILKQNIYPRIFVLISSSCWRKAAFLEKM